MSENVTDEVTFFFLQRQAILSAFGGVKYISINANQLKIDEQWGNIRIQIYLILKYLFKSHIDQFETGRFPHGETQTVNGV